MRQLLMFNMMKDLPEVKIPDGWTIRNFRPGEEQVWYDICLNGLLGENENGAEKMFDTFITSRGIDPEKDTFFVCRENDVPEATITATIWRHNGIGNLHMVAAAPSIRGNGVGLLMAAFALDKLKNEITHEPPITNLTTDDFRLPAIVGYLKAGFRPIDCEDDMVGRWTAICDKLNIHGIDVLDGDGNKTGIVL